MELLGTGIYFSAVLFAVFNCKCSHALQHYSAHVTHVMKLPNGVTSTKLIECAFQLMKKSDKYFVRTAAETDVCELLDRLSPSLMDPSFFTEGFEYLQKSSHSVHDTTDSFRDIFAHHIYSEVEIGDTFKFVFHKMKVDKIYIAFQSTSVATQIFRLDDNSTTVKLSDRYNRKIDGYFVPTYPLQDLTIYKLLFEVFDAYWKITINDEVFTTFSTRAPLDSTAFITVKCGPSVKYMSKAFNPRNQPPGLTVW